MCFINMIKLKKIHHMFALFKPKCTMWYHHTLHIKLYWVLQVLSICHGNFTCKYFSVSECLTALKCHLQSKLVDRVCRQLIFFKNRNNRMKGLKFPRRYVHQGSWKDLIGSWQVSSCLFIWNLFVYYYRDNIQSSFYHTFTPSFNVLDVWICFSLIITQLFVQNRSYWKSNFGVPNFAS